MQRQDIKALTDIVEKESAYLRGLADEMGKVIVGQKSLINRLIITLISGGHILIEGVPGLAKTLAAKSLAETVSGQFNRIQFTPDMLPADVIGTLIYNPKDAAFEVKKGPVFTNFLLADEINRTPPKVQSALLEAMQEHQVTIGDNTYQLPGLFMVLATQNPIEQEGTYPLPEAQLDRFFMKVIIGYPNKNEEFTILERMSGKELPSVQPILRVEEVEHIRQLVREIYIDERLKFYIVEIVDATRHPENHKLTDLKHLIRFGASPRASISLAVGAKAAAFLAGRTFVLPEDIKRIAKDILRHRLLTTYEAQAEGLNADNILDKLLREIHVP